MNVIVSNRYGAMLSNLQIDLIKSINGEFEVDELIAQFENFFFNKMILDITAIKGYEDIGVIQKLSFGFDMSKVILLLDDSDIVNSPRYLSQLVSMGIYNFTRNIDAIAYLIDNPNIYKDVAQYHILNMSQPVQEEEEEFEAPKGGKPGKNFLDDNVTELNTYGRSTRIIGINNLTEHAGATSLIYMLKKQLEANYKVLAVELDKNDFIYFNDVDLRSIATSELVGIIKNPSNTYDVILVDVNNSDTECCSENLYLIEPTTIKLNKMIRSNRTVLDDIKGKKVILNRSLLGDSDIKDFEYEAKCKVFFNIPSIDDKKDKHRVLDELLNQLGFIKQKPAKESSAAKLFGIVKDN